MDWVHPTSVSFWLKDPGFRWQVDALEIADPALHTELYHWILEWRDRPWADFEAAGHVEFVMGSFNNSYSSCKINAVNSRIEIAGIATASSLAPITFLTPNLPDSPFYPPTEPGNIP